MSQLIFRDRDSYLAAQVATNARKLLNIFACEDELQAIATDAAAIEPRRGCCHGARNGWEVTVLTNLLPGCNIIGTDIAPTAWKFGLEQMDFHEPPQNWTGRFDFIYSNSLDHSHSPGLALAQWVRTLRVGGRLYVSHSRNSKHAQNEADCFGANLMEYYQLVQVACHHVKTIWIGDATNGSGGIVKDLAVIVGEKVA
jgi:hypothetical protein